MNQYVQARKTFRSYRQLIRHVNEAVNRGADAATVQTALELVENHEQRARGSRRERTTTATSPRSLQDLNRDVEKLNGLFSKVEGAHALLDIHSTAHVADFINMMSEFDETVKKAATASS